jgi:hypothetical protein
MMTAVRLDHALKELTGAVASRTRAAAMLADAVRGEALRVWQPVRVGDWTARTWMEAADCPPAEALARARRLHIDGEAWAGWLASVRVLRRPSKDDVLAALIEESREAEAAGESIPTMAEYWVRVALRLEHKRFAAPSKPLRETVWKMARDVDGFRMRKQGRRKYLDQFSPVT